MLREGRWRYKGQSDIYDLSSAKLQASVDIINSRFGELFATGGLSQNVVALRP